MEKTIHRYIHLQHYESTGSVLSLFIFLVCNHSQESKITKVISAMLDDITKNSLKILLSSSSKMAAIANDKLPVLVIVLHKNLACCAKLSSTWGLAARTIGKS